MNSRYILIASLSLLWLFSCAKHRAIDRNTLLRQEMFDPCDIVFTGNVAVDTGQRVFLDFPDTSVQGMRLVLFMGNMKDEFLKEYDRRIIEGNNPPCCIYLRVCGQFIEPDELLMYADKMSMAHALEVRVPYLDREIVEHVQRLGPDFKVRNGIRK